jgi:hypothetical protein
MLMLMLMLMLLLLLLLLLLLPPLLLPLMPLMPLMLMTARVRLSADATVVILHYGATGSVNLGHPSFQLL